MAVAIAFGPIMLLGVYYVQTQAINKDILLIGLMMGLLAMSVLWINEIPDYEADKTTGKNNWVVRLGKKVSSRVYVFWLSLTYSLALILIVQGVLPKAALIVF